MPARNMAGPTTVPSNPNAGKFVMMSPFSGPSGSILDNDNTGEASTGALNTGIGFGANSPIFSAPASETIPAAGFNDDYTPGITMPDGEDAEDARLTAIGGGYSKAAEDGEAATDPYNAVPLLGFGAGTSRDAGSGPEHTGYSIKTVTASGTVANGAEIESGFVNRTGVSLTTGQSAFGSATAASDAVEAKVAPILLSPFTLAGNPVEGETLTVSGGSWRFATSVSYTWYADGEPIEGEESDSLTLTVDEVGAEIHCTITATNSAGSTDFDTESVGPVEAEAE